LVAPVEEDRGAHHRSKPFEVEIGELRPLGDDDESVGPLSQCDGIFGGCDGAETADFPNGRIEGHDPGPEPDELRNDLLGGSVPHVVGMGLVRKAKQADTAPMQ